MDRFRIRSNKKSNKESILKRAAVKREVSWASFLFSNILYKLYTHMCMCIYFPSAHFCKLWIHMLHGRKGGRGVGDALNCRLSTNHSAWPLYMCAMWHTSGRIYNIKTKEHKWCKKTIKLFIAIVGEFWSLHLILLLEFLCVDILNLGGLLIV